MRDLDNAWRAPGPLATEKLVYIPPGSGTNMIAAKLESEGVVEDGFYFRILSRLNRTDGALKAGEYKFAPNMSIADIVELLQSGKTYQRMITIAEGLTSAEITALVNAAEAMEGTIDTPPAEGTLLPETYSYTHGDSRAELITRMQKSMHDALDSMWQGRDPDILVKTPGEAVTLASIVEKETGVATERARVAGAFYNRLKINMPLQSDPTVIYAVTLGKYKLERPLSHKDLATPSPYNTYTTPGLPPTPIANPGRDALEAVMHPEKNDYLYFVADGSGGHAFAPTLKAHNDNVAKWRRLEKQQK